MVQTIEIQNGLVSVVERNVQYQVPMADWLDKIEKRNPISTPVLPVGTRAMTWDTTNLANQQLIVLIEQQPQIIRMDLDHEVHELSIPWTRFFFYCTTSDPTNTLAWHLSDYRVLWARTQYNNPTANDMIRALLPNVYDDARICFGSTGADAEQSLAQRLNQTVNEFYISRFNHDLTIRRPNEWRSWGQWERMTQRDPTGWMNWSDWNSGVHMAYSWESLNQYGSTNRFDPMIAAEPIPEIPLGATFGRVTEWLGTLTNDQRARLLEAALTDRALNNDRYDRDVEEEIEEV